MRSATCACLVAAASVTGNINLVGERPLSKAFDVPKQLFQAAQWPAYQAVIMLGSFQVPVCVTEY